MRTASLKDERKAGKKAEQRAEQKKQIGKRPQNMHLMFREKSQEMGLMLRHQEKSGDGDKARQSQIGSGVVRILVLVVHAPPPLPL